MHQLEKSNNRVAPAESAIFFNTYNTKPQWTCGEMDATSKILKNVIWLIVILDESLKITKDRLGLP